MDALLGRTTRPHADLDIAIEEKFVPALRGMLESQGYFDIPRDDTHRWNFVLGDDRGRAVDVHVFILDAAGNVIEGLKYPPESLHGAGTIAGRTVRCITPEHQVRFHTGYPVRETDWWDVTLLCEAFAIELPSEYRQRRAT